MLKIPPRIIEKLLLLTFALIALLLSGCASFKLSTMHYDPIYGPEEVVLQVPSNVKIDTLSYSQLKWKLRTDNTFRWNFAQYAMDQPYSWYTSNFRYSYWRPFNSFDVYLNRHNFWYDWAFNYPFDFGWNRWNRWNYGWGYWNRWHRPFYHWDNWYNGPYSNPGYNIIWNSSRENINVAYVKGPRGGRNVNYNNNNIENTISRRYNNPRPNVDNNVIDNIVNDLRNNGNNVRVYDKPQDININNNIRNNIPRINNNSIRNNNSWNSRNPIISPSGTTGSTIRINVSRSNSNGSSVSRSSGRSSSGGSSRGGGTRN